MLLGCNSPTPPRGRRWPLTYSPSNLDFIGRVELSSGFSNVLAYSRAELRARNGRSCIREASTAFVASGYALREIASLNVSDISRGVVYSRATEWSSNYLFFTSSNWNYAFLEVRWVFQCCSCMKRLWLVNELAERIRDLGTLRNEEIEVGLLMRSISLANAPRVMWILRSHVCASPAAERPTKPDVTAAARQFSEINRRRGRYIKARNRR